MDTRHFANAFVDHNHQQTLAPVGKIDFAAKCRSQVKSQLKKLRSGLETWLDSSDYSVYTGTTGIALLHLHLYEVLGDTDQLQKAQKYVDQILQELSGKRLSFICGDSGPLAIGAVIYNRRHRQDKQLECIQRLKCFDARVLNDKDLSDEILYGRAGYLYALLFVRSHIGEDAIEQTYVDKVVEAIIRSGENLSAKEKSPCPLMYKWHEKKYIGAAHGLAGIFITLLQCPLKECQQQKLKLSVDYVLSLAFPSGNFPSSLENQTDKLLQWCHGAPGVCHMLTQAYKTYEDAKYLDAAVKCGDVIWEYGLLKKGEGLCHGVAGNAYAFLALYQVTQNDKYLAYAQKFAEWCMDYGKHGCRRPDRPCSLFEGLGGSVYFLADMMHPEKAKFPALYI